MEKIGDLCEIRGERVIEWKVKNFFSLNDAVNTRYVSPDFHFCDFLWNIRLYPNGDTSRWSKGWIGIYLAKLSSGSSVTLNYSLALKSTDRNKDFVVEYAKTVFTEKHHAYGFPKFILRTDLMKRKADLAFADEITIICTLKNSAPFILPVNDVTSDKFVQTESHLITNVSMESLSKDFSELLASGPSYDVEVKCGEQSVKAHKMILSVRSEVLKAMLESGMLESRTGTIEIKDMDAHYVQDFVKYLYTGSLSDLTFDKAKSLYEAGDKYAIKSLVLRCSEYLQNNLSPEIVCECLALADAHTDQELKDIVTTYILDEKIYLQDELWLPFSQNYPKLSNEVYRLSHKAAQNKNV